MPALAPATFPMTAGRPSGIFSLVPSARRRKNNVSVRRAPYLLRYRAFEEQEYVRRPGALHIRRPVNTYKSMPELY
ncbi:hypothetical protein EPICR_60121 [Candidatus Desulfarcum epimagneticum]|uniref:Uncharacterized protein n=1 Tax=uncultured Desulfobacteraceae bacterium TaxID=218296 RepID=A0A484HFM7_9BACT|nr:hypothetical protein EPICR_280004 [uncultured Desulfobacteraceae bacterium]VEN75133.1 hypothetical protein EPICR_60121 [uncultured Desulfobacteraceae bacterium]